MAVLSLILGIISLPLSFILIGVIPAVLGVIFGLIARKQDKTSALAMGGLVTSLVGLFMPLILMVSCAASVTGLSLLQKKALDYIGEQRNDDRTFMKEIERAQERGRKEIIH
jgi:hypothetical protein